MNEMKTGTPPATGDTPESNSHSAIISQSAQNPQGQQNLPDIKAGQFPDGGKGKKKGRGGQPKAVLGLGSRVRTLALKFYIEQLPDGSFPALIARVQAVDKARMQVELVCHDKDIVTDGIWQCPLEKPHFHLILRLLNNCTAQVSRLLDHFGIYYRPGLDDTLWREHGVETCANFGGYSAYLRHETSKAIAAGKYPYGWDEIYSNLTKDEIQEIERGAILVGQAGKVTTKQLAEIDMAAYKHGYDLQDFDAWYGALPFEVRSAARMKTVRESYERGVTAYLSEQHPLNRLCVFIQGPPNAGKTYASVKALDGKRVLKIGGGGSGKLDNLRPSHDAIVVDDDSLPNLLNITDNYPCRVYRRNSGNPVWAGKYLVVTSNLDFAHWLKTCHLDIGKFVSLGASTELLKDPTMHYFAAFSRFYICETVWDTKQNCSRLVLRYASRRGSQADQQERLAMFVDFQNKFNATISQYVRQACQVDYSAVLESTPAVPGRQDVSGVERYPYRTLNNI